MPELWKPLLALMAATLMSIVGTVCMRLATDNNALWLAIAGASLWSMSGAAFAFSASFEDVELSVASAIMSSAGLLVISIIGIVFWGESTSDPRKFVAFALIVIAIALLAATSTKT